MILFLGGHSSRWDVTLLLYFMQNNVYSFFIVSHTSVWAQPNNNRHNMQLHKCVEAIIIKLDLQNAEKTKVSCFNVLIWNAWKEYNKIERQE